MRMMRVLLGSVLAASLLVVGTASAQAQTPIAKKRETIVRIWHPPVTPTAVLGSGLGTVRTWFSPIAVDGVSAPGQLMTGTITTVAIDAAAGIEWRTANLVFVVGEQADQLVVGGMWTYPAAGATITADTTTVRPVVGGSGTYASAKGYVVTTNMGATGWSYVFHLTR
jgi:hypothetical protein